MTTTATTPTTTRYIARGSVRGDCGHLHRSLHAAERCVEADQRACRSLPGGNAYSDRDVAIVEWRTDDACSIHPHWHEVSAMVAR